MREVKSHLDVDALRSRTVAIPYPNIKIVEINEYVPVVISALEEGEIPLLATHKGVTKIVKRISRTALNMHKLLRVTKIIVNISENDSRVVEDVLDYMEVCTEWI